MATKVELDLLDNSLDGSNDANSEILGMVGDTPFEMPMSTGVAYRVVTVEGGDETQDASETLEMGTQTSSAMAPNMQTVLASPFNGQLYVIGNPGEVFASATNNKTNVKLNSRAVNLPRKRDDRRRATHNEVERKRRDKINTWITKLGRLVTGAAAANKTNSTNPPPADVQSKGGILAKACEYISELSEVQERLTATQRDNERLMLEVYRLTQEIAVFKKHNLTLRSQLTQHGITAATPPPAPSPQSPNTS